MSTQSYNFGFQDSRARVGWYAILAVLLVVGLYGLYVRLTTGLLETNLTATVPWGTWVAFYIYFVGLSAGAFLVSAMANVLGMKSLHAIERDALFVAVISMIVALLFIQADLGRMDRSFNPLFHRQGMSVLSWEVHAYALYIGVLAGELYFSMRKDLVTVNENGSGIRAKLAGLLTLGRTSTSEEAIETDRKWLKRLGILGIPLAIFFVHGGTGLLFAVNHSVTYWHTGVFPVIFIISAVVSGLGLVIALYVARAKFFGDNLSRELLAGLGKLLGVFILIDIGLKALDTIVGLYGMSPGKVETWYLILFGENAWAFWLMAIFAWTIPLIILSRQKWRRSPRAMTLAGVSVITGVIGTRFMIVVPALLVPDMDGMPAGVYAGTAEEWILSAGFIAFGALIYTVGAELLPLKPLEGGHGESTAEKDETDKAKPTVTADE